MVELYPLVLLQLLDLFGWILLVGAVVVTGGIIIFYIIGTILQHNDRKKNYA